MIRREQFFAPEGRYFLSHSIGLMPQTAAAAIEADYFLPWRRARADTWAEWLAGVDSFRRNLAPAIGASAADICPQTNVSSALSKILFSLPERARRKKIVLSEDDFPTIGFVLAEARRIGYDLCFLPGGARLADLGAWAPAFHDDVQLVLATHVFSNTAVKAPVGAIAREARRRGVFSVLDIAQSAGSVPIELNAWAPDFAIGTSVKYLCGGPGAAYLWTPPETAGRCSPLDVGWFSHAEPFEFNIHDFRYAEGAARYWGGTPSVAPFVAAAAGSKIVCETGVEAIFAHGQRLLSRFVDAIPRPTILSHVAEGERGASIVVAVKDLAAAAANLSQAGMRHDIRMGGVRFSFHLYNDDDDVDALADKISPLL